MADLRLPERVGIDGFNLALQRGTGVATYARVLSHALSSMAVEVDVIYGMDIDRRMAVPLREVAFFDGLQEEQSRRIRFLSRAWLDGRRGAFLGHQAVEIEVSGRVDARAFADRLPVFDRLWNVPRLFRRASLHYRHTGRFLKVRMDRAPEVMHWTYPLPVRLAGARNIYTIHDLVPLRLPHTTLDNKEYHYRLLRDISRCADAICTVSEASRSDILSFFPNCASRVFNTYQPLQISAEGAASTSADGKLKALFGLEAGEYYLFFGSIEPKKNIGRLIEAFLSARTSRRLVLVGAAAWKSEEELRFLDRGLRTGRIRRIDYVRQDMLLDLIRRARAVFFPSLSEGFGLPVLEALSLGTPVVTSREGSLPEIAGEAAVYVDAYSTESITAGIERIDSDEVLHASLIARASGQAALFNMKSYAERLSAMYAASMTPRQPAQ